jgi:hypothetical protein
MIYYSCYSCRGRAGLANDLNVDDPFALAPSDIVERVLMAGYSPVVELPRLEPWQHEGVVTEVHRDGLRFLVTVSREQEMIGLQAVRSEPHEGAK